MKTTLIVALLLLIKPVVGICQWQAKVGLNTVPLITKSVELTSEWSNHPGYAINFNAGYTLGTGYTGLIDYKVFDGVKNRKTSGAFAKLGGRTYIRSLTRKQPRVNFYIGAYLIISQYKQTALKADLLAEVAELEYLPVRVEGVDWAPAFSIGFTNKLSNRLHLDWGFQKTFLNREDNFIGTPRRNYQPGIGSGQSSPFIQYIQGVLTLKYKL